MDNKYLTTALAATGTFIVFAWLIGVIPGFGLACLSAAIDLARKED
jgi:hypothetical protein